jgi:hypothetical protein
MVYALTLVAPLALLTLLLVMERVERPLRREDVGEQLVEFLETARADEVETYVSEGFAPALERYWGRRASTIRRRVGLAPGARRAARSPSTTSAIQAARTDASTG